MTDADVQNTSGLIIPLENSISGAIEFQWNPHKLHREKSIPFNHLRLAGREAPIQQYGCGDPQVYSLEFTLSRMNRGDHWVTNAVEALFRLTKPVVGQFVRRTTKVRLILGDAIRATCFITKINVEYGPLYNPKTLLPYQAKVRITLEEII